MPAARYASSSGWVLRAAAAVAGAAVLSLAVLGAVRAEPAFPALTGRIVDDAGLLNAADRTAVESELTALEQKSTDQLVVVTLKSLQDYAIEDFGYQLGRKWAIGQKGKDNGILLIVAPKEHKVRIEVGRGLEPVMTDALSKMIIENAIVPAFRSGDYSGGIRAGVRDIKDVLLGDAEAVKDRARLLHHSTNGMSFWSVLIFAFWACVVLFILYAVVRSVINAPQVAPGQRRRGGRYIPSDFGGSSGGWSGGDSGGGGFSGGGGDFGGGGSSGSW